MKMKYTLLELKVPRPLSAISETYDRARNYFGTCTGILLFWILPNVSFTTSEAERDYY